MYKNYCDMSLWHGTFEKPVYSNMVFVDGMVDVGLYEIKAISGQISLIFSVFKWNTVSDGTWRFECQYDVFP